MNRRHFLHKLIVIPPLIAVYFHGCDNKSLTWTDIGEFISEVRKIILPSGDGIDMDHMEIERFVIHMLKSCYSLEDQQRFLEGLQHIHNFCRKKFTDLGVDEKEKMIVLMNSKDSSLHQNSLFLYAQVKVRAIQGFTQSKLLMHDMGRYEMAPGRYNGHYKILSDER